MSVVVATNLSDQVAPLVRLAAALGRGGQVSIVHVVPPDTSDEEVGVREAKLHAIAAPLEAAGVGVREIVDRSGDPADGILAEAWRADASLVVLGASSRTPRAGRVARRVFLRCPAPVLIAAPEVEAPPNRLVIAVGIDGSPASTTAVRWARRVVGARVVLLHVWSPVALRDRLGLPRPIDPQAPPAEVLAILETALRSSPELADLPLYLAPELPEHEPGATLAGLAATHGANLLVMGIRQRRERGWWGSMLRGVADAAALPVVGVPDRVGEHALPSYRRVLVATDFSEVGNDAIAHAFAQAGRGGEVFLAHVNEPIWDGPGAEATRAAQVKARLMALVPEVAAEVSAIPLALTGTDPARVLVEAATRQSVDLIVVGGAPHGVLYDVTVGSFVREVLQRADRPVLVVRPR